MKRYNAAFMISESTLRERLKNGAISGQIFKGSIATTDSEQISIS